MYCGVQYCTCKGGLLQLCYALCGNVELLCLAQWLAAGGVKAFISKRGNKNEGKTCFWMNEHGFDELKC